MSLTNTWGDAQKFSIGASGATEMAPTQGNSPHGFGRVSDVSVAFDPSTPDNC